MWLGKHPGSLEECGEDPYVGHLKVCVSMEIEKILGVSLDSRGTKPRSGEDSPAVLLPVGCLVVVSGMTGCPFPAPRNGLCAPGGLQPALGDAGLGSQLHVLSLL